MKRSHHFSHSHHSEYSKKDFPQKHFLRVVTCVGLYAAVAVLGVNRFAFAEEGPIPESYLKLRDPFKRPNLPSKKTEILSELERYSLDELKLLGVITGPKNKRAMLQAPDGKAYFVSEGGKVGNREGTVSKIGSNYIKIEEKIQNVLGQFEMVESFKELPTTLQQRSQRR